MIINDDYFIWNSILYIITIVYINYILQSIVAFIVEHENLLDIIN